MDRRIRLTVLRAASFLAACFLASLFLLAYPVYVIRPFRHQGTAELALALQVLRFRLPAMIAAAALAPVAALRLWRTARSRRTRALAVAAAAFVLACAALSRVNIYEQMFHPADRPEFVGTAGTRLAGTEKVLAVRIGDQARAYPVRSISYHHIVNDRLGGVPLAATY